MAKNAHFDQTAYKKRYNNLCIRFGTWKNRRLNQSRFKVVPKAKFPAGSRRKERLSRSKLKQVLLTDSDAELFMYLIQCIRLGVWTGSYFKYKNTMVLSYKSQEGRRQQRSSTLAIFIYNWKKYMYFKDLANVEHQNQ